MGTCLPGVPGELSWVFGRKVGDVVIGIGSVQFCCIIRILGPGSGYWEIVLLENVSPVEQGHGTAVLRDGVDGATEGHLRPHPGWKIILHGSSAVGSYIEKPTRRLKGRQELELDLGHIWRIIGFDSRVQLVVFKGAGSHIDHVDVDIRMGLVEKRNLLIHIRYPGPVGQGHRTGGGIAVPRTGATTTSGEGSHEYECNGDEGKPGSKASQPWERGEKLHRLKTSFGSVNKNMIDLLSICSREVYLQRRRVRRLRFKDQTEKETT